MGRRDEDRADRVRPAIDDGEVLEQAAVVEEQALEVAREDRRAPPRRGRRDAEELLARGEIDDALPLDQVWREIEWVYELTSEG